VNFFEFIYASNKAETLQELSDCFLKFLYNLRFDYFKFADISPLSLSVKKENRILMSNYPAPWLEQYNVKKYIFYDPVCRRAYKTDFPFVWEEIRAYTVDLKEKKVLSEAESFSLVDGITVPLHCNGGYVYIVNFVSTYRGTDFDKDLISYCNAAARQLFLVYNAIARSVTSRTCIYLTAREKDVLYWIASGRTKQQTAEILNVSKSCVKRYCENIFRKLEVNNLPAAVAKAAKQGLINL